MMLYKNETCLVAMKDLRVQRFLYDDDTDSKF